MPYCPLEVDYERLLYNVEHINNKARTDRGSGRTFAYLTLMLGEIGFGFNNTFVYVAPTTVASEHAQRMFREMVIQMYPHIQIEHNKNSMIISTNNNKFYFVNILQFNDPTCYRAQIIHRVFFDIQGYDTFERADTIINTIKQIESVGGEVI